MVTFDLFVTYGQIALFAPNLQRPFNDWRPQHFAQGFSWRPGSVSFRTLEESGDIHVEVNVAEQVDLLADTKRAILVPFSIDLSGLVEITSIDRGKQIRLPTGSYALIYETGYWNNGTMWCRLTFVASESVEAKILRQDSELSPSYPLLMETEPA